MEPMRVTPYPLRRTFDSFEAAVAYSLSHPRLPEARRDAARLQDSSFVDACWTLLEWRIQFDCDLSLFVWLDNNEIQWSLQPSPAEIAPDEFQRVGCAPIALDWAGTVGLWEMDCSSLVSKRRGAKFENLFFNDHGLFIYLQGHLILHLGRAKREADGCGIIYATEED
jgi:hypothetical protein